MSKKLIFYSARFEFVLLCTSGKRGREGYDRSLMDYNSDIHVCMVMPKLNNCLAGSGDQGYFKCLVFSVTIQANNFYIRVVDVIFYYVWKYQI